MSILDATFPLLLQQEKNASLNDSRLGESLGTHLVGLHDFLLGRWSVRQQPILSLTTRSVFSLESKMNSGASGWLRH